MGLNCQTKENGRRMSCSSDGRNGWVDGMWVVQGCTNTEGNIHNRWTGVGRGGGGGLRVWVGAVHAG